MSGPRRREDPKVEVDQLTPTVFGPRHDRRKLNDWAYTQLKAAIVDFRVAPGQPLREANLAEALGISKTPIREALARLEQEGLVETVLFKGAVATGYSRRDLLEIYELREILESAAARDAAKSISEEARKRLLELARSSKAASKDGDTEKLALLISEFDSVLFDGLANRRTRALIENLRDHITRIGHLTADIPGRLKRSVSEHDKIIAAIRRGDAAAAEASMRAHIRSVRDDQLALLAVDDGSADER